MRYFMHMAAVMAVATSWCGSASAQTAADKPTPPAKEKKTCRAMMPTGTMMSTRVCNTAAAWRAFDGYTAEGADQFHAALRMTTTGLNTSGHR